MTRSKRHVDVDVAVRTAETRTFRIAYDKINVFSRRCTYTLAGDCANATVGAGGFQCTVLDNIRLIRFCRQTFNNNITVSIVSRLEIGM